MPLIMQFGVILKKAYEVAASIRHPLARIEAFRPKQGTRTKSIHDQ